MDEEELQEQHLYPHTENALTMLQIIMQKVTYDIAHTQQMKPEYYEKMCHVATDLAFWIRNIEKNYDDGSINNSED